MEKRERFVPRFVLCITSHLSVSTGSNRAAVAGNCSSLLPGAARVQSRIHEFLVRKPSPAFLLHLRLHLRLRLPAPRRCPVPPIFCVPCVRGEYLTRACRNGDRKKSLDVNRDARAIIENAKCAAFVSYCLVWRIVIRIAYRQGNR